MHEKRKLTRLKLLYHLRVFDRNNFKLLGYLADIHTQGMRVISEHPQGVNNIHDIRIVLPEALEGRDEIHLSVKSLWCAPYVNPLFHQAGFNIQHISGVYVKQLESLVHKYGFQNIFQNQAVQYYRGIEGYNCAQAILKVFQNRLDVDDEQIKDYAAYGGGNAQDGICGALCAIKQLAGNAELAKKIVQLFKNEVGSIYCDEILELGRLSCAGCICTASQIYLNMLNL